MQLKTGLVVLGLATSHCRNEMKIAGTSMSVPIDITDDTLASSLVPVQCASLAPPANMIQKLETTKINHHQVKGSFTSFQMFHTHASLPRGFFQVHPK